MQTLSSWYKHLEIKMNVRLEKEIMLMKHSINRNVKCIIYLFVSRIFLRMQQKLG